jgi:hypothetical protein
MGGKSAGALAVFVFLLASCAGTPQQHDNRPGAPAHIDGMGLYRRALGALKTASVPAAHVPIIEPAAPEPPSPEKEGADAAAIETMETQPWSAEQGVPPIAIILPAPPPQPSVRRTPARGGPAADRSSGPSSTDPSRSVGKGPQAESGRQSGVPGPSDTARTNAEKPRTERTREIYARTGDEVEIGLEGEGFLFLGFPDRTKADGMSFKSKQIRDGKTYFKFKAFAKGDYDLGFIIQDNAKGRTQKETVRIHVVSDADFAAAVDARAAGDVPEAGGAEKADYGYAEKLISLGKLDAALNELMKGYKETDAYANDRIAFVYARKGADDAAEEYYKKNLSAEGVYSRNAVLGMVNIAIRRRDATGFLSYLNRLLGLGDADLEDILVRGARFQMERGDVGVGLDLLAEYEKRYPRGAGLAEVRYLTALFLEKNSAYRDIQRARELYKEILEEFPESRFAGPSRERLRYIEQHFYYVR